MLSPITDPTATQVNRAVAARTRLRSTQARGTTLLETAVSLSIVVAVFAGLYALSGRAANLVRKGESTSDAQRNCLARIDQLRSYGWAKVTRPDHIASLLAKPTGSVAFHREVISVFEAPIPQTSPTPSPAPAPTPAPLATPLFTVTKTGTSAPVISPATFDPANTLTAGQLTYRVLTEWNQFGRIQQRELATRISKSATR